MIASARQGEPPTRDTSTWTMWTPGTSHDRASGHRLLRQRSITTFTPRPKAQERHVQARLTVSCYENATLHGSASETFKSNIVTIPASGSWWRRSAGAASEGGPGGTDPRIRWRQAGARTPSAARAGARRSTGVMPAISSSASARPTFSADATTTTAWSAGGRRPAPRWRRSRSVDRRQWRRLTRWGRRKQRLRRRSGGRPRGGGQRRRGERVRCGKGLDRVRADRRDTVIDCEHVDRG